MKKTEYKYLVGAEFTNDKETLLVSYHEKILWYLIPIVGWLIPRNCYYIKGDNNVKIDRNSKKNNINKFVWIVPLGLLFSRILLDVNFKVIFTMSKGIATLIYVCLLFVTHSVVVNKIDNLIITEKKRIVSDKEQPIPVHLKIASMKCAILLMFSLYIQYITIRMGIDALEKFTMLSCIKVVVSELLCMLFNLGYSMFLKIEMDNKIYISDFVREFDFVKRNNNQ